MAEKDKQHLNERGQKSMANQNQNQKGAKGTIQDNLAQMMSQVKEPVTEEPVAEETTTEEADDEYEHLSDWVEDLIKAPKVPSEHQLELLKAMFEEQKEQLPNDLSESVNLLERFFGNSERLMKKADLNALQTEVTALSSKLNEEMLKGEVNLLAMLYDCETTGANL